MSSWKPAFSAIILSIPFIAVAGCSNDPPAYDSCDEAASDGVRKCIGSVSAAWEACYTDSNAPCAADDGAVAAALATLQSDVRGACSDGDFLSLSVDALVGRLLTFDALKLRFVRGNTRE